MGRTTTKTCQQCNREFARDPRNTWAYWAKAKFCSTACCGKANAERFRLTRPAMRTKFEENFAKGVSCWEWTWLKDKDGYGLFPYAGRLYRAASLALQFDGRPVPRGKYACHHCDNPSCVRPDHLYAGTPAENMADARARGRLRSGERNHSARLTEPQVIAIRGATGTHEEIAGTFGVARATVSLIRERKTWKHLP